jgi:hypothetical protein
LASFSLVRFSLRIFGPLLRVGLLPASFLNACHTPTVADTVDLGDHADPPEVAIDEATFHCVIQPQVLSAHSCGRGEAGEAASCHNSKSALRLIEVPVAARRRDGRVVGQIPAESLVNLEAVRTSVGLDAESSPLYRRPVGLDSHPRVVFAANSEPARLLREWLNGTAP